MSARGSPTTVGVVTGGHGLDAPASSAPSGVMEGIDAYIQSVDDFATAPKESKQAYDVVLLPLPQGAVPRDSVNGTRHWRIGGPAPCEG